MSKVLLSHFITKPKLSGLSFCRKWKQNLISSHKRLWTFNVAVNCRSREYLNAKEVRYTPTIPEQLVLALIRCYHEDQASHLIQVSLVNVLTNRYCIKPRMFPIFSSGTSLNNLHRYFETKIVVFKTKSIFPF